MVRENLQLSRTEVQRLKDELALRHREIQQLSRTLADRSMTFETASKQLVGKLKKMAATARGVDAYRADQTAGREKCPVASINHKIAVVPQRSAVPPRCLRQTMNWKILPPAWRWF